MTPDSHLVRDVSPSPNFGDRRGRPIDALILHYTGMSSGPAARDRLLDPTSEVSAHYLVWEDGRIEQLVAEADRAWHAGRSFWQGETDMNAVSIGIEIVNPGHDGGCPPYPDAQIAAVMALAKDICERRAISAARVLGHSDIAPDRKLDPGEWFPWQRLAEAGIGLWPHADLRHVDGRRLTPSADSRRADGRRLEPGATGDEVVALQQNLSGFGYRCDTTGVFDAVTACAVAAFQRHYRSARVDGIADDETIATLVALR